jgi:hypothetical protein
LTYDTDPCFAILYREYRSSFSMNETINLQKKLTPLKKEVRCANKTSWQEGNVFRGYSVATIYLKMCYRASRGSDIVSGISVALVQTACCIP